MSGFTKARQGQLGLDGVSPEVEVKKVADAFEVIKGLIAIDPLWLVQEVESGAAVLFEGAQSVLLDVLHGTVPYVTGSHTIAANAFVGGDLPPKFLRKTIGVAKAVMSRVGHGPFPSEYPGYVESLPGVGDMRAYEAKEFNPRILLQAGDRASVGRALRIIGCEYGSNTGRPRRIGALDLKALKDVAMQNGIDEMYLTKCDVLEQFWHTPEKQLPIVTGYGAMRESSAKGKWCREPIAIFEHRPGFPSCLTDRDACILEPNFGALIAEVEDSVGIRIVGLGVGRAREDLIVRGSDNQWCSVARKARVYSEDAYPLAGNDL